MFRFDQGEGLGKEKLIDDARRASFRVFGGRFMATASPALLSWDGREIPFEFYNVERTDTVSGKSYLLYQFDTFGSSWTVEYKTGIGPYSFRDLQERTEARLLAIEAVLVNNFKYVEGAWNVAAVRVVEGGREWRVSDFGYRKSGDIAGGSR